MKSKLSRRNFLKAAAGASLTLAACVKAINIPETGDKPPVTKSVQAAPLTAAGEPTSAYMPVVNYDLTPTPPENSGSKVVHIYAPSVTSWTPSSSSKYWSTVNQGTVNSMVNRGIMELTGQSTISTAWKTLLPNYKTGQKIAIKINCNTVSSVDDVDENIDATAEPVNGLIAGLKQMGVQENDIIVFDAVRKIPNRIYDRIHNLYPAVRIMDPQTEAPIRASESYATFTNTPSNTVQFHLPSGIPNPTIPILVTDVLVQANYLINMPLLKKHAGPGVTLSFKNHFGTINQPGALHDYAFLGGPRFRTDYSVFVDIYKHPYIGAKTILTVADGLFGYPRDSSGGRPSLWTTFGNKMPCSLFFSKDPVAIDCVLSDFLNAENAIPTNSDAYLKVAQNAGLGLFERGNPWKTGGYGQINYRKITI